MLVAELLLLHIDASSPTELLDVEERDLCGDGLCFLGGARGLSKGGVVEH